MSCFDERIYLVLNYPSQVNKKTLLTGIKQDLEDPSIYYITGFIEEDSQSTTHKTKIISLAKQPNYTTFVYKGNLSGLSISDKKNWYIFNFPSSKNNTVNNTNLYGPSINKNNDNIKVVGNYSTVEGGNDVYGCLYKGKLDGSGKWYKIIPPNSAQTICHSIMGNLIVGNYLTNSNPNLKAFIYNFKKNKYVDIIKIGSYSITAYGIWQNNNKYSYTICGGYSEHKNVHSGDHVAYIVDYNINTEEFSNWASYRYNNSKDLITHFEGISGTEKGYSLASDATSEGKQVAAIAYVKRKENGIFSSRAKWEQVSVPNKNISSANSIAGTTVIGVATSDPNTLIDGFVSILI